MTLPDAVIFDVDGLLVDTETCDYEAWRELHENASVPVALTPRERECLEWTACGKDQWSIARILNISESTVHVHLESAKRRLGALNVAHAVALALSAGQIRFGDLRLRHPAPGQFNQGGSTGPLPGSAIRATPSQEN